MSITHISCYIPESAECLLFLDAVGFRIRIALGEIPSRGGLHRLPVCPGRFPGVVPIEVDRFAHNPSVIASLRGPERV